MSRPWCARRDRLDIDVIVRSFQPKPGNFREALFSRKKLVHRYRLVHQERTSCFETQACAFERWPFLFFTCTIAVPQAMARFVGRTSDHIFIVMFSWSRARCSRLTLIDRTIWILILCHITSANRLQFKLVMRTCGVSVEERWRLTVFIKFLPVVAWNMLVNQCAWVDHMLISLSFPVEQPTQDGSTKADLLQKFFKRTSAFSQVTACLKNF